MVMDEIMHNPSNKNSAPCLNREIESRWWLVGETPTIYNIASIVSCELCCIFAMKDWIGILFIINQLYDFCDFIFLL